MKKLVTYLVVGLLGCTVLTNKAKATQITGSISFTDSGTPVLVDGSGFGVDPVTGITSYGGTISVSGASGSFAAALGASPVNFATPFNFSETGTNLLWSFTSGGLTYSFSETSIDVISNGVAPTSGFLNVAGLGTISITGGSSTFTSTPGSYSITSVGSGLVVSFGSSTTALPDGGYTVALLGSVMLGLVGMVSVRKKRNLA
jgi:hypothetical protein